MILKIRGGMTGCQGVGSGRILRQREAYNNTLKDTQRKESKHVLWRGRNVCRGLGTV